MLSSHDLAAFDYPGANGPRGPQSGVTSMDLVAEYASQPWAWPAIWAGYMTGFAISGVLVWAFIVTARD